MFNVGNLQKYKKGKIHSYSNHLNRVQWILSSLISMCFYVYICECVYICVLSKTGIIFYKYTVYVFCFPLNLSTSHPKYSLKAYFKLLPNT